MLQLHECGCLPLFYHLHLPPHHDQLLRVDFDLLLKHAELGLPLAQLTLDVSQLTSPSGAICVEVTANTGFKISNCSIMLLTGREWLTRGDIAALLQQNMKAGGLHADPQLQV